MLPLIALIVIKSAQCDVACRYNGFDTGVYKMKHCECITRIEYDDIVLRKITKLTSKKMLEEEARTQREIEDKAPWLLIE